MSAKPILIVQMQRMGDLVLTFPLFLWLRQMFPAHPIWVVAERVFFEGLMPLSPGVTYFPAEAAPALSRERYFMVINLSHRAEAAALAGKAQSDSVLGTVTTSSGATYIHGNWQLYRASLVHNNRHNLYHWADLNGLDMVPAAVRNAVHWPRPDAARPHADRVGLFLGASDPAKRPSAAFMHKLVLALLKRGLKPVLLGGKSEMPLGAQVASLAKTPALNLCGRFSLSEFVTFTGSLRCLITPDTGPMHIAAWMGTPTLNLSMGHVHPWETGPYQPGHHVLRSNLSCVGCWQCKHPSVLCHRAFEPERVAALTRNLVSVKTQDGQKTPLPKRSVVPAGQTLFTTGRDAFGLYQLKRNSTDNALPPRQILAEFWKSYFGMRFGLWTEVHTQAQWQELCAASPHLVRKMREQFLRLSKELLPGIKGRTGPTTTASFWIAHPPVVRPLTGFLHLLLQNAEHSLAGYAQAVSILEELIAITEP